ncbi:MAG: hypothetical protein ACOYNN_00575 [Terrimicrobiaceae bacterium]|jgi:hypothetical protein
MNRLCLSFVLTLCLSLPLIAELAPSAYEDMQKKAPEYLEIEVLRIDVEPGDAPERQTVRLMALVNKVERTATEVRIGDLINVVYTITDRPKTWVGPGEIPLLAEKDKTIAYLKKDAETSDFSPMAGAMSFRNF